DDQTSGSHVPGTETPFPVRVQPPARDVGQVQGRRAAPAQAPGALDPLPKDRRVDAGVITTVGGEPGAHQRVRQVVDVRDLDRPTVQLRTPSALRAEGLTAERVVHQTEHEHALMLERDGDRTMRISMDEIRRAVERVHVPDVLAPGGTRWRFLRHDAVAGKRPMQRLDDDEPRLSTGRCYQVACRLVCNRVTATVAGPDQCSRAGNRGARDALEPPHANALPRAWRGMQFVPHRVDIPGGENYSAAFSRVGS